MEIRTIEFLKHLVDCCSTQARPETFARDEYDTVSVFEIGCCRVLFGETC